jgi:hypothetical protein
MSRADNFLQKQQRHRFEKGRFGNHFRAALGAEEACFPTARKPARGRLLSVMIAAWHFAGQPGRADAF